MQLTEPVDLHLISWNRPTMTELVIKTIHQNTKRENFRLIVLDNGSDGETPYMLEKLRDDGLIDELILIKTNLGLEASRNLLFKNFTQGKYFICIDNDCLPPRRLEVEYRQDGEMQADRDWIERLVSLMEYYPDYAAVACRTQVMIGTGNIFETADEHGDDLVEFPHPGGSLRIMRTDLVNFVGGWEREATGRGAEERYICGKLNEAGFKTAFAAKVECLHLFGLRGSNPTDRWGYDKNLKPEDTGHSDIYHPVLEHGDDPNAIRLYAGVELTEEYVRC